ncbi:hypothetical protein ACM66B_002425 [Microbotryomycetes sp. NB124-2]
MRRILCACAVALLAVTAVCAPAATSAATGDDGSVIAQSGLTWQLEHDVGTLDVSQSSTKVPVVLGVMSKCPDAQVCEIVFDRVLDQVGQLADLNLVYIGQLDKKSEPYGVECMHGESECAGNVQQLCAAKHFQGQSGEINPWADWWNFIQCVNYGPTSRIGNENVAKSCAGVVGHKWDEISDCVNGHEGAELLQMSVKAAQQLKITKSCTIVIGGKPVCIHDGTWKSCEEGHEVGDFVRQIRQEWKRLNSVV